MLLSLPCRADIGPSRHRAAKIKANKVSRHSYAAKVLTEILPRHVMPRQSREEVGRIIVRHFFLGQIMSCNKSAKGKSPLSQSPGEHSHEDGNGATARRVLLAELMLVSRKSYSFLFYSSLSRLESKEKSDTVGEMRAPP
jgi:hypothetical protein